MTLNPPSPPLSLEDKEHRWDASYTDLSEPLLVRFGEWQVRQDIHYLDHGAFGGCPKEVSEKQGDIRQWMEENPHEFFERSYVSSWETSRKALAEFINVDAGDLVLLPGATHGLNVVIQSLKFQPNDEILTTNHAYSSVKLALEYVAKRDNAVLVVADISLHVSEPSEVLTCVLDKVTTKTRFAVIDHVPSRSGMIFPVKDIVSELARLGVDTMVDGAHAPGMIPLNVRDINAAYYVANCHKWMCAPRGTGFLHVRPDHAHEIKPLVIARSPYVVNRTQYSLLEHSFGWMGTSCPSAVLTLPTCIDFLSNVVPGGHNSLISRNHELAVTARRIVCETLGIPVPCPDSMIGAMATIPLPDSIEPEQEGMLPIQQVLWNEHAIVVPVYSWPSYPKRVIRLSVQAYNTLDQYHHLAKVLRLVLQNERNLVSKSLTLWNIAQLPAAEVSYVADVVPLDTNRVVDHGATRLFKNKVDVTDRYDIANFDSPLLTSLAQARIRKIIRGDFVASPVAIYPSAGGLLPQFAKMCRLDRQHANLEFHRITHMLTFVNRRRIPHVMAPTISQLLATNSILEDWVDCVQSLRNQAHDITRCIISRMAAPLTPAVFPLNDKDFVCRIIPYETEKSVENLSLKFWRRALTDFITAGPWNTSRIKSFLQIHAFLKEPVGGLRQDLATQTEVFVSLLKDLKPDLQVIQVSETTWEEVAAQLALESSFISQPLVRETSLVHFFGDEQLVYSYCDIDQLARSEFACSQIVVGMIKDILAQPTDECTIAPITVAQSYSICSSHDARAVVVDGNNRITTICFLRFVAVYGMPAAGLTDSVREYCRDYGLGPILAVDLYAVLQTLWQDCLDVVAWLNSSTQIGRFRHVRQVPVLVTEEASFFTKEILPDGSENVLQPVHQSIFATDVMLVALPSKMQSHGRSNGFKPLPIR